MDSLVQLLHQALPRPTRSHCEYLTQFPATLVLAQVCVGIVAIAPRSRDLDQPTAEEFEQKGAEQRRAASRAQLSTTHGQREWS